MGEDRRADGESLQISVVIVTWRRPEHLRRCLTELSRLDRPVHQVLVVDASTDSDAAQLGAFPWATRVEFADGAGHMTRARNEALLHATGDVIAFLDDDAYARSGWSVALESVYRDPEVAAVAGRTCNGEPGEDRHGIDEIGRVQRDGLLTGNFGAVTETEITVDHGIGANMSFRREILAELGGFRDDFRGVGGVREDTDIFLRVRALGRRAVFAPAAVVDHVGAPHAVGRRFDWRYMFWARHNHALLLARNYGLASPVFGRWLIVALADAGRPAGPGGRGRQFVRASLMLAAIATGLGTSICKSGLRARDPRRRDMRGRQVTTALNSAARGT